MMRPNINVEKAYRYLKPVNEAKPRPPTKEPRPSADLLDQADKPLCPESFVHKDGA